MVTKSELKILIKKHFDLLRKKNTINIKQEDENKLIEYFSDLIYFLQLYNNIDMSIDNNRFMSNDDFITVLCACNNTGA